MSMNKMLSFAVISSVMALSVLPVRAESVKNLERDQIDNSTKTNVDASASRGDDKSVVNQERDQIRNTVQPNVDPGASKGQDPSIVDQERAQIPH
ncbi:hypothetical protein [Hyphomicrobium facile]|uniref:Uncharacterized protein n=1 Tax=Hyphomicrobium facile TaxID=51670 RepID=A0A1I7NR09_9HYPH|nr:hypothetical protein [Hyphomicrobium facile]SFV37063.1 hypothetical protein SAMN04488557_2973 [Hyphomicrobium facile]